MPLYFFHLHFGGDVARDPIGLDLPTLGEAIAQAEEARVEIMKKDNLKHLWIEIADRSGHIIATIPSVHP